MEFVARTRDEIDEVEGRCVESTSTGQSAYAGMSYEDGILAVLGWLFDKDADPPFDEE